MERVSFDLGLIKQLCPLWWLWMSEAWKMLLWSHRSIPNQFCLRKFYRTIGKDFFLLIEGALVAGGSDLIGSTIQKIQGLHQTVFYGNDQRFANLIEIWEAKHQKWEVLVREGGVVVVDWINVSVAPLAPTLPFLNSSCLSDRPRCWWGGKHG